MVTSVRYLGRFILGFVFVTCFIVHDWRIYVIAVLYAIYMFATEGNFILFERSTVDKQDLETIQDKLSEEKNINQYLRRSVDALNNELRTSQNNYQGAAQRNNSLQKQINDSYEKLGKMSKANEYLTRVNEQLRNEIDGQIDDNQRSTSKR